MDPQKISIRDYSYALPENRIAKYPLAERDASKLLIYKDEIIKEDIYRNIADHLPVGSFLLFNNSKVIEARILFHKQTGGIIEIFCLEPSDEYADISTGMKQEGKVTWKCLIGGVSKWKHGQVLEKKINGSVLQAKYISKKEGSFLIEFSWSPAHLCFAEILHIMGSMPLPPYLKRSAEQSDKERYQTIYAETEGSVAAPTAGLHFTPHIFKQLDKKQITRATLTLHVGAGTFKPVKTETLAAHEMHAEFFEISASSIQSILDGIDKNIIAVGTTSLRALESLYWIGVKKIKEKKDLQIHQWEAYESENINIPASDALTALLDHMNSTNLQRFISKTELLIVPGYKFRLAHALITNFHQPQSTLLLLVAAFIGDNWKQLYGHALNNEFRFLSYGDGCLLWRNKV